jgi:hypothetical protein
MNELRPLKPQDLVLLFVGGGVPSRYVLTTSQFVPPVDHTWGWIETFEGCNETEARRLEQAGRQLHTYETGALLFVDGKPALMVTPMTEMKTVLAALK